MAKERIEIGKKVKGLFNRTRDTVSEEDTAPEHMEEAAPVPEVQVEPTELLIEDGALLDLWHRWNGEAAPLVLSMTDDRFDIESYMESNALVREKLRLKLRLEQDAKKRLLDLNKAEQDGASLGTACYVYLSENKMLAWLLLYPPSDPEEGVRFELIGKALQAAGVTTGLDSAVVMQLFQKKAYFQLTPIAFGTPPVQGEDGQLIEHFSQTVESDIKIDENGMADYRSHNYVQLIKEGDVICDIIPPKEGKAGVRVDGKIAEPKPVRAKKVSGGRNTVLSEDGLHLSAATDGHLVCSHGTYEVKSVLEIQNDVDYSTGNIDFHGDVHIHGNVRANFTVRATGTILVDGLVEAATIEAGGDLVITSGVLGDYKASIKSQGNIRVKYLENCVAYAGKSIYADCIMLSQVFSDDTIDVTGGRGTVIGGSLTAGRMIKARMIGSQSGRKTRVVLGVLPIAESTYESIQAELNAVREDIQKMEKELQLLVVQRGKSDDTKVSKAHLRKSVLEMKEAQLVSRAEEVKPAALDLTQCRLESGIIYPITKIEIAQSFLNVETVWHSCKARYDTATNQIITS